MPYYHILTADLHLTDNPLEEYRWQIFDNLRKICVELGSEVVDTIVIAGDLTDRKDKHSAVLLNRVIAEINQLKGEGYCKDVKILMGNHDMPLNGPPYWQILDEYVTEPIFHEGLWLLPFNSNPAEAWKDLPLEDQILVMHQTIEGAVMANGVKIPKDVNPMPDLSGVKRVFSGDVHRPQLVRSHGTHIYYIGAPHPVKFDETWANSVVELSITPTAGLVWGTRSVSSIFRAIIDIKHATDFTSLPVRPGDQYKIRYHLDSTKLSTWPEEERIIKEAALEKKVVLVSLEAILAETAETTLSGTGAHLLTPSDAFKEFCDLEKVDPEIAEVGKEIITKVCSALST